MKIEHISKQRVLELAKQTDYLVWQGCGAPIEDWYNGITNMLIENEIADKNYKMKEMYVFDNNGVTALMRAAYGGYPSLVEKLLAYGADKDMTDKQGRVALDYVREHCRAQLEPILR